MIVDGEKYACDACIRGHRVSSCTHKDRKLNHVNKKGRPLTQCPHCRGLRKSRAAHVKCDCGEAGHSRNSSVESTGDAGCKCQAGKRCNCALKKEALDLSEIQRANSAASSSRRFVPKPGMPPHHSDSSVPRIRAPVPPLHRLHNAPHDHSHPYAITRPRPMTETLHTSQRSLDGSERARPLPTIHQPSHQPSHQPGAIPMDQRQLSNPVNARYSSPPPRRRPAFPALRVDSQTQMPDFSASLDVSTMHKAISPGNPARYSFHDLSEFTLGALSRQVPEQNLYAISDEMRASQGRSWQSSNLSRGTDDHGYPINPNPVTPSDVSIEYSLSSQFGLSSSGTMSEPGDVTAQPNDFARQDLPFRSVPPNPASNFRNEVDVKINMAPQNWAQYLPSYAASDPGAAFNGQGQVDHVGFNMDDLQGADAGPGPFVSQNMVDQYDPIMSDDAVRDWVPNPAQMHDPNFNYEVPTHYPMPMMERSYGWI